ncbi:MAG: FAD-dependent oxidoreductase, partial [Bryobacteraceae bacterium]
MARTSRRSFVMSGGAALTPSVAGAAPAASVRVVENVPVIEEADICVLGGSCTGVFAAVRAARLG